MKARIIAALTAAVAAAAPARAEPNLVAHYAFDDCTATDLSGSGNHGALVGNVTCAPGQKGNALRFGGLGDVGYVNVPASPSLAAVDGFTYSLWFRIDTYLSMTGYGQWSEFGHHALFAKEGDSTGLDLRTVRSLETGALSLWASNGNCCGELSRGTPPFGAFGPGEWHLATVSMGGGVLKLYLDGALQTTVPSADFMINPGMASMPLRLGIDAGGWWYPLGGMLDEVRVYDRALGDAEVAALFLPVLPRADAGPDGIVECPATPWASVTLDGSRSSGSDPLAFLWTWTDGTSTFEASGVSPTITLPAWGTYDVGLRVTDASQLTSTDSVQLTVGDTRPPRTIASVAGTRREDGVYTSPVKVTLTSRDACTGVKAIHYTVNGVPHVHEVSPPLAEASTIVELDTDGTYEVTFWAVDAAGRESAPVAVPAIPVAPVSAPGGEGGHYPSCVSVTLVSVDGAPYFTQDGGVTWQPYTGAFQVCAEAATAVSYGYAAPTGNVEPMQTIEIVIDLGAPTLQLPGDIIAEATGPAGAVVTYTVTAHDAVDPRAIVSCTPASGSTFPFGTTAVTCTARDASGRQSDPASFTVTVVDTTRPVITITGVSPGETYALGLVPAPSYTVTDSGSGAHTASATSTGADAYGLGTITYAVVATDVAGNEARASVTYVVIATIPGLESLVGEYRAKGDVTDPQLADALLAILASARTAPNVNEQDGYLQEFAKQARAQSGKKISAAAAGVLENAARYVIAHN